LDSKVLDDIRSEVCDTVLKWTAICGIAAVLLSFLRYLEFGFLPIMAVHGMLIGYLLGLYTVRKRVPYTLRAASIIGVMMLVAVGGHLTFGTPTRIEFFVAASIMSAVFFGERNGIIVAAVSVMLLAAIYATFSFGVLAPPVPTPPLSITNWIANTSSMLVAAMAPLLAVNRYRIHLNSEHQRLAAANRAKSDFLATMSHELRTPMTAILGMSDILLAHQPPGPLREQIGRISRAGRLLLDLLTDVLDFSKIEANAIVIRPIPFKPAEVVQEICDLFTPMASEKGLALRARIAPHLHRALVADAGRLRQAVLNLVGNAVKFTERGTIEVSIGEEQRGLDLWLRVDVKDTGIGITEEQQAKLFQPFVQAMQGGNRRYGGTGLGLAISKRFAELMGGELTVRSAANQGSVFTISIPVKEAPDVPIAAGEDAFDGAPGVPLRLLVADDTETIRVILKIMLQKWGHTVDAVEDGRAAVAAARTTPYDAILMDMQMPEMDGLAASRAIREMDAARRTPIIAITADVSSENREACLNAGITALLTKPVNWPELARTLRQYAPPRESAA
jgi:signal transduction histidine kinase/CheY-like chemotaxis protein